MSSSRYNDTRALDGASQDNNLMKNMKKINMADLAEMPTKIKLLRELEKALYKANLPTIVELSIETNMQELISRPKFIEQKMHHSGPTAEAFAQASSHIDAVVTAHSIKYERTVMDVDGGLRMCANKYMTDFATDAEKEQIDVDTIRFSDLVYLTGERGNGGKTMVRGTFEMSDKSEEGFPQWTPSFKAQEVPVGARIHVEHDRTVRLLVVRERWRAGRSRGRAPSCAR